MRAHRYRQKFRLYRRRHNRMLFGVCGGLADYFECPAWCVRVAFLILACVNWVFIAAYVALALLMKREPSEPYQDFAEEEFFNSYETSRADTLAKIEGSFEGLEKRLQNVESIVTKPGFGVDDELRNL